MAVAWAKGRCVECGSDKFTMLVDNGPRPSFQVNCAKPACGEVVVAAFCDEQPGLMDRLKIAKHKPRPMTVDSAIDKGK